MGIVFPERRESNPKRDTMREVQEQSPRFFMHCPAQALNVLRGSACHSEARGMQVSQKPTVH